MKEPEWDTVKNHINKSARGLRYREKSNNEKPVTADVGNLQKLRGKKKSQRKKGSTTESPFTNNLTIRSSKKQAGSKTKTSDRMKKNSYWKTIAPDNVHVEDIFKKMLIS